MKLYQIVLFLFVAFGLTSCTQSPSNKEDLAYTNEKDFIIDEVVYDLYSHPKLNGVTPMPTHVPKLNGWSEYSHQLQGKYLDHLGKEERKKYDRMRNQQLRDHFEYLEQNPNQ